MQQPFFLMPIMLMILAPRVATKLTADSTLTMLCCWVRQVQPTAKNARNHSQCDSMLIGDTAGANTYPYIQARLGYLFWGLGVACYAI